MSSSAPLDFLPWGLDGVVHSAVVAAALTCRGGCGPSGIRIARARESPGTGPPWQGAPGLRSPGMAKAPPKGKAKPTPAKKTKKAVHQPPGTHDRKARMKPGKERKVDATQYGSARHFQYRPEALVATRRSRLPWKRVGGVRAGACCCWKG